MPYIKTRRLGIVYNNNQTFISTEVMEEFFAAQRLIYSPVVTEAMPGDTPALWGRLALWLRLLAESHMRGWVTSAFITADKVLKVSLLRPCHFWSCVEGGLWNMTWHVTVKGNIQSGKEADLAGMFHVSGFKAFQLYQFWSLGWLVF